MDAPTPETADRGRHPLVTVLLVVGIAVGVLAPLALFFAGVGSALTGG